jgi:hypothetical protein
MFNSNNPVSIFTDNQSLIYISYQANLNSDGNYYYGNYKNIL